MSFGKKKSAALVLFALCLVMLATACGPSTKPTDSPEDPAEKPAEKSRIVVMVEAEPPHLDWQTSTARLTRTIAGNINATLVSMDKDGKIQPCLAKKWTIVDDTTVKFELVEGAKFHNGREITAEDVKNSIERGQDPQAASPVRVHLENIKEVVPIGEYEVDFLLKTAYAPLFDVLTRYPIIPIEEVDTLKENPVGAGPFVFKEWARDQYILMEKNPDYFMDGLPKVDELMFRFVPEYASGMSMLDKGEADAHLWLNAQDVDRLKGSDSITLVPQTLNGFYYVGFNTEKAPWNNPKVREAIRIGVDRDAIVDVVFGGYGKSATIPIGEESQYFPASARFERDVERAKQLIEEAGLKGNQGTLITPNTPIEGPLGEVLQQQLKELGIEVECQKLEVATFLDQFFTRKDFDLGVCGSTSTADPNGAVGLFITGGGSNAWQYSDKFVDDTVAKAFQVYDVAERRDLYGEVYAKLIEDVPLTWLARETRYMAHNASVKNVNYTPFLEYDFSTATKTAE